MKRERLWARTPILFVHELLGAAGAQLAHGIGQFAYLTLACVALLFRLLPLKYILPAIFVDHVKSDEPREVAQDQQSPEDFHQHYISPMPQGGAARLLCDSLT